MSSVLGVDTNPSVFLGVWTNWSKNQVLGSTLTMTQKNGNVVVAFVALFITFVGARFWRIVCVAIHHAQSSAEPQDGIYHQRQAILKNADNPLAGFLSWYQLLMAWRKIGHRTYHRLLPMAILSACIGIGFIAASLLSSRVGSAMGEEVLVRGTCGVNILGHHIAGQDKNPAVETSPEFFTVLIPFLGQRLVSFSNYALSCYATKGNAQGCNTYVKSQLPFTSNHSAACPFQDGICRLNNSNILIDTGYIDSHKDLGMNARPEDRFLYRRTTHCAPLVSEGYTSTINYNNSGIPVPYIQYNYGANGPVPQPRAGNVTYVYPQTQPKDRFQSGKASLLPEYTLGYNYANVINGSSAASRGFTPIPEIARTDADVTLFFLSSNQVTSPVPINDPWYAAHQTVPGYRLNFNGWGNLSVGAYFADETASVLGCAKQYQICLPSTSTSTSKRCSRMGGKQELAYLLASLSPTPPQRARITWAIMAALTGNELDGFVQTLGAASLSSKYSLVSGVQGPLPDDQWQRDVEHWHAASLVAMQGSAVDSAMGPSGEVMRRRFWAGPVGKEERVGCGNQKILSSAHSNFSVFGLAFTFTLGGIIIILSFLLESPPSFVKSHLSKKHTYSQLEWSSNSTLQLQRMAHEELGMGAWSKCTEDVPITRRGEMLGVLSVRRKEHPVLTVLERGGVGVDGGEIMVEHEVEVESKSGSEGSGDSMGRVRRVETALSSTSTAV